MAEKYIELNLDDEKAGKVVEVLSNKTAKKMLGLLAEEELSEGDIAKRLNLAANTVNYNIKKLVDADLAEKSKSFFWSVKGKKIPTYKLSNKKILISPKRRVGSLLASILTGALIFGAAKLWMNSYSLGAIQISKEAVTNTVPSASVTYAAVPKSGEAIGLVGQTGIWSQVWVWALAGVAVGAIIYFIFKKAKQKFMKGGFGKKIKI